LIVLAIALLVTVTSAAAATTSPEDLLEEGRILMDTGACEAALVRFDDVAALAPRSDEAAQAHYLAGQCLERAGELETAVERFGNAMTAGRGSEVAVDARFRRGLAWLALDEPRKAQRDFRSLLRTGAPTSDLETAKLDLQLASCQHGLGRDRRATDLLLPALETLTAANAGAAGVDADPEVLWYLSQAHVLAGDLIAEEMDRVSMDVPTLEAQREGLKRRIELFEEAGQHYRWAGHLSSPLWVCAAGYQLGQLHERQRRGVLEAPAPDFLTAEQQAVYAAQLHETLGRWLDEAMAIYRDMLSFAAAAGVRNRWVDRAEERLAEGPTEPLAD
jgi:tetratricopeptide (TPR) repeat protein